MTDEFQELMATRDRLRERARKHWVSVTQFYDKNANSFRLQVDKPPEDLHLTTTATCLESLETCPTRFQPDSSDSEILDESPKEFAEKAIKRNQDEWMSDDSAHIYCRCRALPYVIANLDADLLSKHKSDIENHIDHIFRQIELAESEGESRLSIGEAYVKDRDNFKSAHMDDWYPPNGFHTYWCLQMLETLADEAEDLADYSSDSKFNLNHRKNLMIEWAWQELGTQVGLHEAMSSTRDSDQLMWTIATIATFDDLVTTGLEEQDLITSAIRCLFDNQEDVGTWRHQKPLFHYESSGNAYSHIYEALNAIIEPAVERELPFLQMELAKYRSNFERLLDYMEATAQSLDDGEDVWSSGHRTNNTKPEGWATANVFSFVQNFRRLIGHWTRDVALDQLPTRSTEDISASDSAVEVLLERGNTWCFDNDITVGEQLKQIYLDPLKSTERHGDPDSLPIPDDNARSAILFGPPGTSKTTMIRAIAEALDWRYVEIHSSHFVAEGLNDVQKTANLIFQQVSELDRCVVLFDEIDELVRSREEADVYGRFLTTSMLPRIGELWEERRVIYFVATNHIEYFDPAIVRGERFDAAIFVPPPAFEKKITEISDRLKSKEINLNEEQISISQDMVQTDFDEALVEAKDADSHESKLSLGETSLAPFVILRYDELSELVDKLEDVTDDIESGFGKEDLGRALEKMQNQRFRRARGYMPFLQRDRSRLDYSKNGVANLFE